MEISDIVNRIAPKVSFLNLEVIVKLHGDDVIKLKQEFKLFPVTLW